MYRHVDRFYTRLLNRVERRGACHPLAMLGGNNMSSSPSPAYIMEDPREGSRLEQKVDPDAWVRRYLQPHLFPGAHVLDVGCGPGRILRVTASAHRRAAAPASISGRPASARRERTMPAIARLQFVRGDVQELEFESGTFDVVYSRMLLQYVPDKEKAVGEMVRVCKPGGTVLMQDLDGQLVWHYPEDALMQQTVTRVLSSLRAERLRSVRRPQAVLAGAECGPRQRPGAGRVLSPDRRRDRSRAVQAVGAEARDRQAAHAGSARQRLRSRRRNPEVSQLSAAAGHVDLFERFHRCWREAAMTVFANRLRRAMGAVLAGALLSGSVSAQDFPDVTAISLEDLMNLKVTSVSKREQKLADAAAAIFVITQEDIRRSGARNIPEALRLAPGLEVARIDANKWAIASRGFNGRFTNKLLVLIDGRSVYTPLFSGVYWNVQDVLLEDVDRIEVIRGPGATLWGANAVNGVINIITKEANATQGGLVDGAGGRRADGPGGAVRRQARRERLVPRLFQVLQVGLVDRRERARRVRRVGHRRAPDSASTAARRGRLPSRCRATSTRRVR